jgi:hypothetical protein
MKKTPKPEAFVPPAVIARIKRVFAEANATVTRKLSEIPTTHEPSLDMSLIDSLSRVPQSPPIFGWQVRLETHFLGGRALFANWEVADIGLLVFIRQGGKLLRTKLALLQSKRLYPDELKKLPDLRERYRVGFASLLTSDEVYQDATRARSFHFTRKSRYRAFVFGNQQHQVVTHYEKDTGVPVYYLLYNPMDVPLTATVPLATPLTRRRPVVGARVVPASVLTHALGASRAGKSPTFADISGLSGDFAKKENTGGWRLEHLVADLLLQCKEGYVATHYKDTALFNVFFNRSAPITAAISVGVDAPEGVTLVLPEPASSG